MDISRARVEITSRAYQVFRADVAASPPMTLRGGDAVDSYWSAPPYDTAIDQPTDAYLERYAYWALNFLDAASWRHYLPRLIDYALHNLASQAPGTMAIDGLLWSLRPPDREPPRLASLTPEQETVVVAFLEQLAFADDSLYQEDAMQVLEEWWLPGARYRPQGG